MARNPAQVAARLEHLNEQTVRRLVAAHATRDDEPLVLAIRYRMDDVEDVHLLEVIENFPGEDSDPPLVTGFSPSAELRILGELHLALMSPAQLRAAVARGDALIEELRRDGQLVFPAAPVPGEAAELLRQIGLAP